MGKTDRLNYYEHTYESGLFGLERYCSNFGKQVSIQKWNLYIALYISILEVVEFACTVVMNELIAQEDVDTMFAWTFNTYGPMIVVKTISLAWLVFSQWDSKYMSVFDKI